ncbi:sensor histidine kinase [Streptomyces sp. NPDC002520]
MAGPAMPVAVLLGIASVLWWTTAIPSVPLLAGLAGALGVAAIVSAYGARAHSAARQARAADLEEIAAAVAAVEKSLLWSAEELCRGGRPPLPDGEMPRLSGKAAEIAAALGELQVRVVESLCRVHDESQSVVLLEVLRRLAQREHALVGRALTALTALEKLTDDPALLTRIFAIDHLVTRLRRHVESTAVLGGDSLRSERRPVSVLTVIRGAISEVLQYPRVTAVSGPLGTELGLPGHVGPDVTHILAELIENATDCSDPATRVIVRAQRVSAGLAIDVEDRAIPMHAETRRRMNDLLADPGSVDVSSQVRAGQLGLLTAATIAQRHGISIELQENVVGGTTALVVVPDRLLVAIPPVDRADSRHGLQPRQPGPPPRKAVTVPSGRTAQAPRRAALSQAPPSDRGSQPDEVRPLPRRPRGDSAFRPPAERQQAPATAPTPGLAAAFREGAHAGDNNAPAPDPHRS